MGNEQVGNIWFKIVWRSLLQRTVLTPCVPATARVLRGDAIVRRGGKGPPAPSWTAKFTSACRDAPNMAPTTWKRGPASASPIGLEQTVLKVSQRPLNPA